MRRFRTDRRAIAAIEFAMILPLLAFLLLASVDVVTWLEHWFRAERTAMAVADIVARSQPVSSGNFQNSSTIFAIANDIAQPLIVSGNGGATIISCLTASSGTPRIGWQQSGTTNASYVSKFGAAGATAALPNGFSLASNETVIVTEIYSGVQPWILSVKLWPILGTAASGPTNIYTYAIYRPRSAQLC